MARYIVEKEIEESPCEHPLCDQLHDRFMQKSDDHLSFHMTKRVEWLVIDTETGNQVYNASLKKHCVWEAARLNNR
jgi:hypothetical protein